jgi:hypothetical protein
VAIEEATYTVAERDGEFEIRDNAPHVLAETVAAGDFERAGNEAFSRLFRHISGDNRSRHRVAAATAQVSKTRPGRETPRCAGSHHPWPSLYRRWSAGSGHLAGRALSG